MRKNAKNAKGKMGSGMNRTKVQFGPTELPFQGGYAWCGYFKPQAMPEAELSGAFSPGKKTQAMEILSDICVLKGRFTSAGTTSR
jgi:hypothetical protein